jgi:GT2 family glycosyltransferase
MHSLAIAIPVRNRQHFTAAILQQLSEQIAAQSESPTSVHIVVVDDKSTDGTPALIAQKFPQVHLLHGDGDLWWTGAIAQAMAYAADQLKTDYILWLNDDIVLAADFLSQALRHCQDPSAKRLIGGIVCAQQHPEWIVFGGVIASRLINDVHQFEQVDQPMLSVDTLNGNIALLPTRIINDIGLPDTRRFRHYGGDFEYICRAKQNGYTAQLSRDLSATADYDLADVVRYMPLWMQWAASDRLIDKWQVLQKLTNRRSPHNVEHMVNSIYRSQPSVPRWKYIAFYGRKLVKIIGSGLVPWSMRKARIQAYCQRQNVPDAIAQALLNRSIPTSNP